MIKINLASRKQPNLPGESKGGKGFGSLADLKNFRLNLDDFRGLPIKNLVIGMVIALIATYLTDHFKDEELHQLDDKLSQLNLDRTNLQAKLKKTEGFDKLKKQLDEDEKLIRNKLEVIQKLIADRSSPPRLLVSLSKAIPADVWLTELSVKSNEIAIKGHSLGFNQISDFMKNMNESAFFTDLSLKQTQQAKDETGQDIASFDLVAQRRNVGGPQ